MSEPSRWAFPHSLQPTQGDVGFDLKSAFDAVVALRAAVPDDAFTASILGTERLGNGVVIRDDGLVLTIGYLITEAASVWLTANDGSVIQGHPLAYDFATGFGLIQPLGRPRLPVIERGSTATVAVDDVVAAPGASPEDRAALRELFEVLDKMPNDLCLAWSLRYMHEETVEIVAELCGCSLATAKRRIAAAQGRINEELSDG